MPNIPSQFKPLAYLLIIVILAFCAAHRMQPSSAYWVVWVALSLSLVQIGETFNRRLFSVFLTGIALLGAIFLGAISHLFSVQIIFIPIISGICAYYIACYPKYALPIFFINIYSVIVALQGLLVSNLYTLFYAILIATGMVLFAQLIYWPHFLRHCIYQYTQRTLFYLQKLNIQIFSCYLDQAYSDNIYLFERRLHQAKQQCMRSLLILNTLLKILPKKINGEKISLLTSSVEKLTRLYDDMLDYAQLRKRITDYTIFNVCHEDLRNLEENIDTLYAEMLAIYDFKNPLLGMEQFEDAINQFENTYQQVTKISTREPLVFLLFIESLKVFINDVREFYASAMAARKILS